ncbi:unnamed protein product [Paramecium octaurelia]|uniref:Uncharacterized protein n=1 Tax=Paramecium octaurelia TaxID=43137 RepID=A0A8S1TZ43_PAROT|nr:unnamed protein product [Paramecium octaurelia]
MGCVASKSEQLKSTQKQALQLSQTQQIQSEEQSKFQMTKSPLSCRVRAPSINNSKPISKEKQNRIEKLLFNKKSNINNSSFQCPEEEQAYQRAIIRLIAS